MSIPTGSVMVAMYVGRNAFGRLLIKYPNFEPAEEIEWIEAYGRLQEGVLCGAFTSPTREDVVLWYSWPYTWDPYVPQ